MTIGFRKTSSKVNHLYELINQDVEVYRNLTKGCLSIRHKGYVVAHLESVTLKDVKFKVSQSGRNRVIQEKRKNVHAVIRGKLTSFEGKLKPHHIHVRYNPYIRGEFFKADDNQGIHNAYEVVIQGGKIGAYIGFGG